LSAPLTAAFGAYRELADRRIPLTDRDLAGIVSEELGAAAEDVFVLEALQVGGGTALSPTASVRLRRGEEMIEESAMGDGMTPDYPADSGKDLFWVRGSEIGNYNAHMGAWGTTSQLTVAEVGTIQGSIDAVRARGGITVMNHPARGSGYYDWNWDAEILPSRRHSMIEAFNAGDPPTPMDHAHLDDAVDLADASHPSWWIGTDDSHNVTEPNKFDR